MPGCGSGRLVEGDHARTAQTQVVLERGARAFDLGFLRRAAQLAGELVALRQAGSAQWMALGQQAARRIDDEAPTVSIIAVVDELDCFAVAAKSEGFVADQLWAKQSCSSITVMSSGPMPACSYTCRAASRAMPQPTTSIMSRASNVLGRSVVIACAAM